jgi:hypothetical protein
MMKRFGTLFLLLTLCFFAVADDTVPPQEPQPEEQPQKSGATVLIYPNPFVNELNIRCDDADIKKVEIWTFKQELIFISPVEIPQGAQLTVNTSAYVSGYYVVKIYTSDKATKTVWVSK